MIKVKLQETIKPNISNKSKNILGIDRVEQFMQRRNFEVSLSYHIIVVWLHSRSTWATVNAQSQWEHSGWSCRFNRYEWVRRVWPMWSLLKTTASWRWDYSDYCSQGLTECNLFKTNPSHSACQRCWQWLATSEYRSVAGHFTADILRLRADLAVSPASSLPLIPI